MRKRSFFTPGCFMTGCNYWASHAGTNMWSDWRADVVGKDLKSLKDSGLQVLRVFPLWSEFQPVKVLRTYGGDPLEFRQGEECLQATAEGLAGVSQTAAAHFEELVHIADKYGLRLIISLLNGWMSGRLFVPPALENRNLISDPMSLMWEIRFVKYFVKRFMNEEAIIAWEPGNECNCMSRISLREEAWTWTAAIADAIRSVDTERPVISGMHGLSVNERWTIEDQGELTDILTVHPYPLFTPYCDIDPINTMRGIIHASVQACYYSDMGGKPCLAEEFGTLGPMISSETAAGDFVRGGLFSQWTHGCLGGLWWCAFDQTQLNHAPYKWYAVERELGLFRSDGSQKPALEEMRKFTEFIKKLPFMLLPERIREGVCILSDSQDHWGTAFGTFMLAKQAGFDITFQYSSQPLKESSLYLLPCISGHRVIDKDRWTELLEKVYEGAVLYISYNDGVLSNFSDVTGLEVQTCYKCNKTVNGLFDGIEDSFELPIEKKYELELKPVNACVLGRDSSGNPVFSSAAYGKGRVCFLAFPLETQLVGKSGAFCGEDAGTYWKIYRYILRQIPGVRAVCGDNPVVGITEHPLDDKQRVIVFINYSPASAELLFEITGGWEVSESLYGSPPVHQGDRYYLKMDRNDAAVLILRI